MGLQRAPEPLKFRHECKERISIGQSNKGDRNGYQSPQLPRDRWRRFR